MLSTKIQANGLRIFRDAALASIWHDPLAMYNKEELFRALFTTKFSLVYHLVNPHHFCLPGLGDACDSGSITASALADAVLDVARRHTHSTVNEVHLFSALLALCPGDFHREFASIRSQYRQKFPGGTARQQWVLAIARASGRAGAVAPLARSIGETPMSRERVTEDLEIYLSAAYYPFDDDAWERYSAKTERLQVDDHSLVCFSAHRLRDAEFEGG